MHIKRNKRQRSPFHKLFLLFLIVVLPIFLFKEYRLLKAKKQATLNFEEVVSTEMLEMEEKSFVIIVAAHNNVDYCVCGLQSIFNQNYPHFRVVYIDGGSDDGTFEKTKNWIKEQKKQDAVTLIREEDPSLIFKQYYKAVHRCQDDEIVVHLEGRDWFAHEGVLRKLNQIYDNPDIWLTYSQYLEYPSYKKGISKAIPKKSIYKKKIHRAPWVIAHLKTYYAGLFKHLKVEEDGVFLSMEDEKALLIPMADLAKSHVRFIPEVLYIHNPRGNGEKRKLWIATYGEHFTNSLKKNKKSEKSKEKVQSKGADLILFSRKGPEQLQRCLDSIDQHVSGIHQIVIFYEDSDENEEAYERIQVKYPSIHLIKNGFSKEFKDNVLKMLNDQLSPVSYITFATDDALFKGDIELMPCINAIEKTHAYAFYFHLGQNGYTADFHEENELFLGEKIYSWKIEKGTGSWGHPNNLKFGLYRKQDLTSDFEKMRFDSPTTLIEAWEMMRLSDRKGLVFARPKIFNFRSRS